MSARTREHNQKPPGNVWRLFYFRCLGSFTENQPAPINDLYASRFARIGGEEFAIMLPGTNATGAVSLAEKLRLAVYQTPVNSNQNQFNITASFGVAEVRIGEREVDQCLGRADSALYAAKKAGRNCVMSFAAIPHEAQKSDA